MAAKINTVDHKAIISAKFDKAWDHIVKLQKHHMMPSSHKIHTPRVITKKLVGEILKNVEATENILVLYNVEFVLELLEQNRLMGANTSETNITFYSDDKEKTEWVEMMCVKVITELPMDKKFDVVVGNPPFQAQKGNAKISVGTDIIKLVMTSLVKDDGVLAMISSSTFLGGGQKGLGYFFSDYNVIDINLNVNKYFNIDAVQIGYMIIQNIPSTTSSITIHNGDDAMAIDTNDFVFNKTKRYIPRNITPETLPIFKKIVGYNNEIFDFRASASKGATYKVGFWAGRNSGISPKYLKVTKTGEFKNENLGHPAALDADYPMENIEAVFKGILFHFVLNVVNGSDTAARPANMSYFPKVDLSVKWTFDTLADEFGLTAEEKQVVLDWAATKGDNFFGE